MQALDQKVFTDILQGDVAAFEILFKSHYSALCRFAYQYLSDKDAAEEVVQSAFIGFWEKKESIQIDASLKSYLYSSVRNACLNELKRLKVRQVHAEAVVADGERYTHAADHQAIKNELESKIQEAIEALPDQCKLIFRMSRFEDLKYQEIADALQISIKTVENQMGKALKLMRLKLKDYLPFIVIFSAQLLKL
ncbi:RNA polymerase sigma-70 factor [Arthrospiribacter ruber]|uniref:RNA polymerase sigma-70 factor n=1 Tax=Arthrospiribacter ruber TaxID=2487934 RepID=A0A951IVN9_9BACT|nr:RNA polymerase sigma-70 factor [Arthrospiribacter ruber]MBW3466907.1 RNA polymerase sigma-70 factor [Arthrospiribacter ruber]